ncbi:hypothetical protein E3T55_10705 [Cryobacterium frigoriphilum]|uniref:O-antigen ligase-related domain-containing protein n=1 Tax=Cryobacterium frigoriphilum TaxID=1259150 RepID=A0A4R9A0E9_9MICO|nr:O-antigen ligase family protein [Cryobacterium frigoriphilum]TFD49816.1 hypothetical protein E3T55_10705 [Cryobacterium frigoriphilum]
MTPGHARPMAALVWFCGGALLAFQTGEGLTPTKLGYVIGVIIFVVFALVHLKHDLPPHLVQRFRPALLGCALLSGWILLVTAFHSLAVRGIPFEDWARDALTYLLIPAGVVLGVSACTVLTLRFVRGLTLVIGTVSALAFAVAWIQRRGFGEVDSTQSLLSSIVAISIALALSFGLGLAGGRRNLLWMALAAALVVAVLVTGTRTGILLIVVLAGMAGAARKQRVGFSHLVLGGVASVAAIAVLLPTAGALFSSRTFVTDRLASILTVFNSDVSQDYSGAIRERAYAYAGQIYVESPFFGQGVGEFFPNPNPGSGLLNFSLDTPLMYPAKFGLFGTIVLFVSLALIVYSLVRRMPGEPWLLESTAVRGAALFWVCLLPFGATTEDKGFAVALALALALVGAAAVAGHPSQAADEPAPDAPGEPFVAGPAERAAPPLSSLRGRRAHPLR